MKMILAALAALAVMLTACDDFVKKTDTDLLKEKQKKVYILKKDIDVDGKKLKKGDRVKIVVSGVKDWIKVHAYPAREDALKAERTLILFLFADDFPERHFSMKYFEDQMDAVASPESGAAAPDKKARK